MYLAMYTGFFIDYKSYMHMPLFMTVYYMIVAEEGEKVMGAQII